MGDGAELVVRLLDEGDEELLVRLSEVDHLFEHDPAEHRPSTVSGADAAAFLADPAVRFWLAMSGGQPVGMLHCVEISLLDAGSGRELLLYDLGTHADHRRRGIATALVAAMEQHAGAEGISEVWLGASRTAVDFYRACGYLGSDELFMAKELGAGVDQTLR
jgi:GNAT superfamily N-acetyltransferase